MGLTCYRVFWLELLKQFFNEITDTRQGDKFSQIWHLLLFIFRQRKQIHSEILKICTKFDENYSHKKKEHALACPVLYSSSFSLYITRQEIDKKKVHRIFCHVFVAFLHPIFKRERRSDEANEACCNGRHWLQLRRLCR